MLFPDMPFRAQRRTGFVDFVTDADFVKDVESKKVPDSRFLAALGMTRALPRKDYKPLTPNSCK